MQAVGKLGSYIRRSASTVSGPFHPFGGAVDIIVVEQPDGSFKSSPWYVRFGKFQGVLKTKEKVVSISVNGVEADFHMYLDHKGEAFFLKEVDVEMGDYVCYPPSWSGEDVYRDKWGVKSKGYTYERSEDGVALTRTNSRRSKILGLVFGRRSMKGEGTKEEKNECGGVIRTESLERAEIAADLLELKWSTNLASSRVRKDNVSRLSSVDISKDEVNEDLEVNDCCCDEADRISHSSNQEADSTTRETSVETAECVIERETSGESVGEDTNSSNSLALAKSDRHVNSFKDVYSQSVVTISSSTDSNCSHEEENTIVGQAEINKNGSSPTGPLCGPRISNRDLFTTCILASRISEEEQLLFGDMDDFGSIDAKIQEFIHDDKENDSLFSSRVADRVIETGHEKGFTGSPLDQSIINDYIKDDDILQGRRFKTISSDVSNNRTGNVKHKGLTRMVRSLPIMEPLRNNIEASDVGFFPDPLLHPGGADNNNLSPDVQTILEYVSMSKESKDGPGNPSIGDSSSSIDSLRGSERIWPSSFRNSRSMKVSHADMNGSENLNESKNVNSACDLDDEKDVTRVNLNKKFVKILTPTSEQLASLNLKEGENTIIFTFSTSMLGKQQVDARIFLWRWDTRIVISDVDGTITRSDLLGQVMPFVGRDWSQAGVVHLFSAIKENGYQLLFLSARSISQAFHTRQFLFNIRQDGKTLPAGPVVISPDGLFPSLFREVVRRAPHEFKIGCLENIKALFPADRNPFYAGFGNRDTDEFSYLKVGIPKGKIFIINPKGEIVVNHGLNTKSYMSFHTLVHGMFPAMSSSEKEDFNSWNYWKLPPIDI